MSTGPAPEPADVIAGGEPLPVAPGAVGPCAGGGSVLASRDRRVPHRLAMIRPYPDGMVLFLAARPARNRTMGGDPGGTAGLIRVARG